MGSTLETCFVKRKRSGSGQLNCYDECLIETACSFSFAMQRHRNDARRSIKRSLALDFEQLFR
jgi:hypothetical protein